MSRGYSRGAGGSFRAAETSKTEKPRLDGPEGVDELNLPDLRGATLEDMKGLWKKPMEARRLIDQMYPSGGPRFEELNKRLFDWEEAQEKYERMLKKDAKGAAKAERTSAKEAKLAERNRIKGASQAIITSLEPQANALASSYFGARMSDLDRVKNIIEEADGRRENLSADEEEFLKRSGFAKFGYEEYGPSTYVNAYGKTRYKGPLELDEESANAKTIMEQATAYARRTVEEFAAKLVEKTEREAGKDEKLVGAPIVRHSSRDPWSSSTIEINTTSRKLVWKTNMIWNRSKLDKNFNQFPTRLLKNEEKAD